MKVAAMFLSRPPIDRNGFFHFGDADKSEPVNSLELELRKAASTCRNLSNSLIVLPEALNILNDYIYTTRSDPDPSVAPRLKEISMSLGVVFVAGLIIESRKRHRYSCACLIDGEMCRILSCKTDDAHNYKPHPFVFDQPALYRGTCIAALVCHDAAENPPDGNWDQKRRRHKALACQIEARRHGPPAVLCIPGRMGLLSSESVAELWIRRLTSSAVILANGTATHASVIRFGDQLVCSDKAPNAVRLHPWAQLKRRS